MDSKDRRNTIRLTAADVAAMEKNPGLVPAEKPKPKNVWSVYAQDMWIQVRADVVEIHGSLAFYDYQENTKNPYFRPALRLVRAFGPGEWKTVQPVND